MFRRGGQLEGGGAEIRTTTTTACAMESVPHSKMRVNGGVSLSFMYYGACSPPADAETLAPGALIRSSEESLSLAVFPIAHAYSFVLAVGEMSGTGGISRRDFCSRT